MNRFGRLCYELARNQNPLARKRIMATYLVETPPQEAFVGLPLLFAKRRRTVSPDYLCDLAARQTALPRWLIDECVESVGDTAEAVALLLPPGLEGPISVGEMLAQIDRLRSADDVQRDKLIVESWMQLSTAGRFVFNRFIVGRMAASVNPAEVCHALAEALELAPHEAECALFACRERSFSAGALRTHAATVAAAAAPFPCGAPEVIAAAPPANGASWHVTWARTAELHQLLHRSGHRFLWQGQTLLRLADSACLSAVAAALPEGTTLVLESLTRESDQWILRDLAELEGEDLRGLPLRERLALLDTRLSLPTLPGLQIAEPIAWRGEDPALLVPPAPGCIGIYFEDLDSRFGENGARRLWRNPRSVIYATLLYAERCPRTGGYRSYTFGVRDAKGLVPVAKLAPEQLGCERAVIDDFVESYTRERYGPVRQVEPLLNVELEFERVVSSRRHKAGVQLQGVVLQRVVPTDLEVGLAEDLRAQAG